MTPPSGLLRTSCGRLGRWPQRMAGPERPRPGVGPPPMALMCRAAKRRRGERTRAERCLGPSPTVFPRAARRIALHARFANAARARVDTHEPVRQAFSSPTAAAKAAAASGACAYGLAGRFRRRGCRLRSAAPFERSAGSEGERAPPLDDAWPARPSGRQAFHAAQSGRVRTRRSEMVVLRRSRTCGCLSSKRRRPWRAPTS